MKKKILLTLIALMSLISGYASVSIDGLVYNVDITTYTATIVYDDSYLNKTSVIVPECITYSGINYTITGIGNSAFGGCTSLTSITIPNSVTTMGDSTFIGCMNLTSIAIPNNVMSIGNSAFRNCISLTSITIPNSVTSIGSDAFSYCTGLTSVTIPNSVTSIESWAFCGCTGLTSITIPGSVTSIGEYAFYQCRGLTSITIPNSVTSIGCSTFNGCTGITSIVWNAKYANYSGTNESPFRSIKDNIISFTFGMDVDSIPSYLCSGLSKLTSITIPNSVTSIGEYAFYQCSGLTSITIPNSVTSIGGYAFDGCSGITSITIPNSVTNIGSGAFLGCTGLTSITISNSVTSIERSAFLGCTALTSITIPGSVTSIGAYAFKGCTGLTSITIPNSVTSIGEYAFYQCSGLTSITIPNSVTSIESCTFGNCTGLTSVTIPNSVTSLSGFSGCTGLTSITIPNSVTSIGSSAFSGCTGLTSITIPNSVTSIGSSAFSGCTGLTSITIPNSVTSIGHSAFSNCTGLASVVWNAKHCDIHSDMSHISFDIFAKDSICSFTFGNEVDSIPSCLCRRMTKLTSITIPKSVTGIGRHVFQGCTGITSIVWNAKHANDNYDPFWSIEDSIISFTFGDEVDRIPTHLCHGMINLKSIRVETPTPPQCFESSFFDVPKDIPLYIPCGKDAYQNCSVWSSFLNIIEESHVYNAIIHSSNGGVAERISYTCDNEQTIQATANEHYHFTHWSDGNTENPRTFVVYKDTTLTAFFAIDSYTISTSAENGYVEGAGVYDYGTQITLTAVPNSDYEFKQWSNGVTDNPYRFMVVSDLTLEAKFVSVTAIDHTSVDTIATPQKVLIDGQVYILRNGKTYTLTGVEVE